VHGAAAKGTVSEVHGGLPLEVAYYLLNRKKRELTQIENDYEIEVTVKGKTSYLLNQLELETVKRDIPRPEDQAKSEAEAEEAHKPVSRIEKVADKVVVVEQAVEGVVPAEGAKKRKRRRKKKKGAGDAAVATEQAETTIVVADQVVTEAEDSGEDSTEGADDSTAKPKKRKRRRGRKGPKVTGDISPEASQTQEGAAIPLVVEEVVKPAVVEPSDMPLVVDKPKRARPARVRKKPVADAIAETPAPVTQPVAEEAAPIAKPRRRSAPKKAASVVPPAPEAVTEKPKPAPRSRAKKKVPEAG
jgi:ribonuclease E